MWPRLLTWTPKRAWERVKDGPNADDLAAAEAKVAAAQAILDEARLTAPISGTVTYIDTSVGDLVSAQTPAFQIDDLSHLYTDISVSEVDISQVQVGQPAEITFDAIEGKTYTGKVTDIASTGTSSSGAVNFDVTLELTDKDAQIKPGMTATANVTVTQTDDVLLVPSSAIRTANNQSMVYIEQNGALRPVMHYHRRYRQHQHRGHRRQPAGRRAGRDQPTFYHNRIHNLRAPGWAVWRPVWRDLRRRGRTAWRDATQRRSGWSSRAADLLAGLRTAAQAAAITAAVAAVIPAAYSPEGEMTDYVVDAHGLTKVYQMGEIEVHALCGVDVQIARSEVVAIMGPSGSGKSTLMNILGCLDRPTSGDYLLDGEPVAELSATTSLRRSATARSALSSSSSTCSRAPRRWKTWSCRCATRAITTAHAAKPGPKQPWRRSGWRTG